MKDLTMGIATLVLIALWANVVYQAYLFGKGE